MTRMGNDYPYHSLYPRYLRNPRSTISSASSMGFTVAQAGGLFKLSAIQEHYANDVVRCESAQEQPSCLWLLAGCRFMGPDQNHRREPRGGASRHHRSL